jgi:DNA-binding transcriptional MerR regulator
MADPEAEQLTIDQLAQRTAMTVRNIRAHQSRGLLPPPDVRARTGYYGPEHIARIELIRELQADGYNLDLIRRLLENTDGSSAEVLRFTRAVREPFSDEQPTVVTVAELVERWGTEDPKLLERAQQVGILRPLDGERFEEVSPRLGRAADELLRLGVPAAEVLELALKLRRNADAVATTFARLFVDSVWKPFDAAGRPEERWPEVQEALERLRPLASEAFLAMLQLAMDDVVETEFGRTLDQSGSGRRRRR